MGKINVTSDDLLGYAMDGFPIYGPLDDVSMLDDCNGMYNENGNYQYHVQELGQVDETLDYCNGDSPITNWNYILGCYSGSVENTEIFDSTTLSLPSDCILSDEYNAMPTAPPSTGGSPTETPSGSPSKSSTNDEPRRPNIIVMQPDDLRFFDNWGPPPNNPTEILNQVNFPPSGFPNVERLRTNGVQMMQAYTASPACGTSRFTTITGKYASRAASSRDRNEGEDGVSSVTIPTTKLEDHETQKDCTEENLGVAFKNAGYRTGMVGKWHLSRFNDNTYTYPGAVETVQGCGFDYVDGLYIENLVDNADDFGNFHDGSFSHNMEWITHVAIDFINQTADVSALRSYPRRSIEVVLLTRKLHHTSLQDEPFFLYFNPTVSAIHL